MEYKPTIRKNITLAGTVIGIAALSGCGADYRESPADGVVRIENNTLYTPGDSESKSNSAHCEGTVLEIHIELDNATDHDYRYVNDPICANGKITAEDFEPQPAG